MNHSEKNLNVLKKRSPVLAEKLADFNLESHWEVYPTTDSLETVKKVSAKGHSHYIHSRFSPRKEAEKWTYLLPPNMETFVALGFGLGYHLLALQRKYHLDRLAVIESDIELFLLAMKLVDLTTILQDPRVYLFIDDKISEIRDFLNNLSPGSVSYRGYLPSISLHPEYYQPIKEMLEDYIFEYRLRESPVLSEGIAKLLAEAKR